MWFSSWQIFFFYTMINVDIKTRIYCCLKFFCLEPFLLGTILLNSVLKGLKWLRNYGTWTTWHDLLPPTWEMVWKIFFTFDFCILREHGRISGRIFPWHISLKKVDSLIDVRVDQLTLQLKSSLNSCIVVQPKLRSYYCKPELISWR